MLDETKRRSDVRWRRRRSVGPQACRARGTHRGASLGRPGSCAGILPAPLEERWPGSNRRRRRKISRSSRGDHPAKAAARVRGVNPDRRSSAPNTRGAAAAGRHLSAKRMRLWCEEPCDASQLVPRSLPRLGGERRRPGHRRCRPAAQPCPPAKVEILPLHEERLVEAAELAEDARRDEHRGAVRAHRRDRCRRPGLTGRGGARKQVIRAGRRVSASCAHGSFVCRPSRAGAGSAAKRRRIVVQRGRQLLDAVGVERDIVVQEKHERRCRPPPRRGCRESRVPGSRLQGRARRCARATADAAVGRAGVDDDHLGRELSLRRQARETVGQQVLTLVVRRSPQRRQFSSSSFSAASRSSRKRFGSWTR